MFFTEKVKMHNIIIGRLSFIVDRTLSSEMYLTSSAIFLAFKSRQSFIVHGKFLLSARNMRVYAYMVCFRPNVNVVLINLWKMPVNIQFSL